MVEVEGEGEGEVEGLFLLHCHFQKLLLNMLLFPLYVFLLLLVSKINFLHDI